MISVAKNASRVKLAAVVEDQAQILMTFSISSSEVVEVVLLAGVAAVHLVEVEGSIFSTGVASMDNRSRKNRKVQCPLEKQMCKS